MTLYTLNLQVADTPGIQGWQWEVAVTYTELLVQLVIFGRLSTIQKRALLGSRNVVEEVRYVDCTPPLTSAGLLDMLHFHVIGDASGTLRKFFHPFPCCLFQPCFSTHLV